MAWKLWCKYRSKRHTMRFYRWISWINWHKNKSEDYKSLTESVIIDFPKKFNIYQDKNMLACVWSIQPNWQILSWGRLPPASQDLIWRLRDVPRRLIGDVPRTFLGRPLEDLDNTQTWMSKFFFNFSLELIWLTKSKSISTLKVYWEPSKTSKMEHFLQN